jgi:archaellum component FlaG (FlaF/FlaG flagellin family)
LASTPIVEGILIVASIAIASMLSGVVLSKVYSIESILSQVASLEKASALTRIKFVYLSCVNSTSFVAYIKNSGILPVNMSMIDVLIGAPGSEKPIWSLGGSVYPISQSGSQILLQGEVGAINITIQSSFNTSIVSVRLVYPNGVSEYSLCSP